MPQELSPFYIRCLPCSSLSYSPYLCMASKPLICPVSTLWLQPEQPLPKGILHVKNIAVGCCAFLQEVFQTQRLERVSCIVRQLFNTAPTWEALQLCIIAQSKCLQFSSHYLLYNYLMALLEWYLFGLQPDAWIRIPRESAQSFHLH